MRCSPIGVFYANRPADERRCAAIWESAITHLDPRCTIACAIHTALIAAFVGDRINTAVEALALAESEALCASEVVREIFPETAAQIPAAVAQIRSDILAAQQDDPEVYGPELFMFETMGYVRLSFRLGLWHLVHSPSVEASVRDLAQRGADSDTHCAIVGSLLGAMHGADSIPPRWIDGITNALTDEPRNPFNSWLHPRVLFGLVDP